MKKHHGTDLSLMEFEQKAQSLISLMFALCEATIREKDEYPAPELVALTKAALALQNALEAFLAIARINR